MARYQQGDSDAATALVHRLSPQLHRFFLVQLVSRQARRRSSPGNLAAHPPGAAHLPPRPAGATVAVRDRAEYSRGPLPQGASRGRPRRAVGGSVPISRRQPDDRPGANSGSRSTACDAAGEPARSDRDVEGVRHVARRGGARHFVQRRERQAERPIAPTTNCGKGWPAWGCRTSGKRCFVRDRDIDDILKHAADAAPEVDPALLDRVSGVDSLLAAIRYVRCRPVDSDGRPDSDLRGSRRSPEGCCWAPTAFRK